MTKTESTNLHIDPGTPLPGQLLLLEGRLGALREMKDEFLSERDRRNGYTWRDVEKKTLHRILFCLAQMIEEAIHESERDVLFAKYEQTKKEIEMMDENQNNPGGVDEWSNKNPSGGDEPGGNADKALILLREIKKTRETINSQLDEVKTQAKSKINALNKAEKAIWELSEQSDQSELFKISPELSPEAKAIINNPII